LADAALISLDHDLKKETPESPVPGDGVDVASFLVQLPCLCPVILHTSNTVPEDFFPAVRGSKLRGESIDADQVFENAIALADSVVIRPGKVENLGSPGSISRHDGPQFVRTGRQTGHQGS
jgi:hypothetical protein